MARKPTAEDAKALEQLFVEAVAPPRVIGRPFQPGQSGNPSGKAHEAEGLDENLRLVIGKTGARKLARSLYDLGVGTTASGHVQLDALKYIFDRLEGRPRPSVEEEKIEEHRIVALLRQVTDDSSAFEAREVRALGTGAVVTAEVRELAGEGT